MKLDVVIKTVSNSEIVDSTTYSAEMPSANIESGKSSNCKFSYVNSQDAIVEYLKIYNYYYTINIDTISFSHEMYKPLRVDLSLTLNSYKSDTSDDSQDINASDMQDVAVAIYRSKYSLYLLSDYTYTNLVVGDIKYRSSRASCTSFGIDLILYSPDHLMTLNKSSKCYTGQLMSQIAADSNSMFQNVTLDASKLHFLKSKDRATEYKLPYIVQYQESNFDFLSRVSRRYGELMYYSAIDNKLHIGCEVEEKKTPKEGSTTDFTITWKLWSIDDMEYDSIDYHASIIDLNRLQTHTLYRATNESAILADSSGASTSFNKQVGGSGSSATLSNLGLNAGRVSTSTQDKISSFAAYDDYNTANNFASKGDCYSSSTDFFMHEKFWPTLFMTGINSPTLTIGLTNVAIKAARMWLDFWGVSDYAIQLYEVEKSAKNSKPYDEEGYSDSNSAIEFSNIALVELYSEYALSNMITINYGATSSAKMKMGHKVTLNGVNYFINSISFDFDGTTINSKATALPIITADSIEYCFPAKGEAPSIREAKSQVAFVVDSYDPSGLNRVRVKYPWQEPHTVKTLTDEQKNLSGSDYDKAVEDLKKENLADKLKGVTPWIRQAVPMASSNGSGLNFMPAEGDEVMVNYEDGNVERPYVDGLLFSQLKKPLFGTSANMYKYIKSSNGHSLTFYDNPDASDFVANMFPLSDITTSLLGSTDSFKDKNTKKLAGYTMLSDTYGMYNVKLSSDERAITIASPYGTVGISAFEGITLSAPNGNIAIKGKNISLEAGNNISIVSGSNIKNHIWKDKADSFKSCLAPILSTVFGAMVDFSLIRTLYEAVIRPVDGALTIKSNRNVILEAGEGNAAANVDRVYYNSKTLDCVAQFGAFMKTYSKQGEINMANLNRAISIYNSERSNRLESPLLDSDVIESNKRSISRSDFDSYLPEIQTVSDDDSYHNFTTSFDAYDTKLESLNTEFNASEGDIAKTVTNPDGSTSPDRYACIERKVFIGKIKALMATYRDILSRYNQDTNLKGVCNRAAIADDTFKKYIFNFVQGKGADAPFTNFNDAAASSVPKAFRGLRSADAIVKREAFCILMIHFADFIKGENFGVAALDDETVPSSDIFGLSGGAITLYKYPIGFTLSNYTPTKSISIPDISSVVKADSGVYLNWDKIKLSVNRGAEEASTGKKIGLAVLDAFMGDLIDMSDDLVGFCKEAHVENGSGSILLSSAKGHTTKFHTETGRFVNSENQMTKVLASLNIQI